MNDDLGDLLGVWAHPDDEAYLSAGLMMAAVSAGHRVSLVTATRGEAGFPADDARSKHERMRVREEELADCLAILGVREHRWLEYRDGSCADVPDAEAAASIAGIIDQVRPDTVLTFGPDGLTWHPDHIAVCRWTTEAIEIAATGARLLYATKTHAWLDDHFRRMDLSGVMMVEGLEGEAVDEADLAVWFSCDQALLERKIAALLAQTSQVEPLARQMGSDRFAAMVRDEFFRASGHADPEFIKRAKAFSIDQGTT